MTQLSLTRNIPKLIGITGHAGAGKDTAASYAQDHFSGIYIHAFADALKKACAELFGVSGDKFYDRLEKETIVSDWGVTPRMMAQFVGTELVREHMWKLLKGDTDDFWIRRLVISLQNWNYTDDSIVIVPDVRFQNEFDWIISNGGYILHLTRPGFEGKIGIPGHKSEAGISPHTPERIFYIANNSTLDHLYTCLDSTYRDIFDKFFPQSV